ncbi:flagellar biosynthetic protein FliR [Rhodococcus sp. X156]|uniref:flagellar biosynthetic protein FliR n=1 Tax=Rhodococcus sp. X156 TaxID=2499145 RepID=UPI000FD876C2|nr:flagellar biosynthetic protein FliR [Rhodococcus sp. X156]
MSVQLDTASLLAVLLASIRIGAWLMIAPPLATAGVPRTVRMMLAGVLSLVVVGTARQNVPAAEIGPLVGSAVQQLLIGAALGFLTRLLFTAVEAAGTMVDLFGGFSLAAAYDPLMANTNAVFGRLFALLTTVLIFASNAHLVIITGFLRTFTALPLDATLSLSDLGATLVTAMTDMFIAALQIAAPMIAVLFIADVALGLLSRISPHLNIFSVSFPLKIGLTLGLVGLVLTTLPGVITTMADTASRMISAVIG